MILITSFDTLVIVAIQLLVSYFLFKVQDRYNMQLIVIGTIIQKLFLYAVNILVLKFLYFNGNVAVNFLINLGFVILSGFGLYLLYSTKGSSNLSRKAIFISILNTIILYVI
jgi:hypothetical protein